MRAKAPVEYFAAEESVTDCVSGLIRHIEAYYKEMNRTGRVNLYRNSYFKFYQGFIMKGALYHSGQEGELVNTYVNHYANLITHMVNMVCQQKLSYEPQTTINDSEAQDQIKLAKGILYTYANRSDMDLDGVLRNGTEMSCVFGEAYISALWNKYTGRTIAFKQDEEGQSQEIKEGDNEYRVWSPFDVIVDTTLPAHELSSWLCLRKWENKFEVAAEYPDWADDIISLYSGNGLGDTQLTYSINETSDIIPVYYFFHKKTAAVPEGRFTKFIDDTVILSDGKLPYREIPLYRMATRELWGSPYAYSRAFDLLPLQETIDRLCSAIVTNQLTFATQNIAIAKGSSISWENIYGGLNVIEWDATIAGAAGLPKALQLTASPKEAFDFINTNIGWMGTLAGINEVVRGNPDLTLKGQVSGEALAMMTSNSIQFNSDLQKAYVRLAEQVGTATVHNIQDFAFPDLGQGKSLSRPGMTLGANNRYTKKEFTKTDIDKIDKIIVRYGNPLAQTTSGRIQMANSFIQEGWLKNPREYIEVCETGNLEPLLESDEAEMHLIQEIKEQLRNGEKVVASIYDNHPLFILEGMAVLSNLDARKDVKVIQAVQDFVEQHKALWKQLSATSPEVCGLMKIPVLPPPQPMAPPGMPGQGVPPPNPGQNGHQPPPPNGRPSLPSPNGAGLKQSVPLPMPHPVGV